MDRERKAGVSIGVVIDKKTTKATADELRGFFAQVNKDRTASAREMARLNTSLVREETKQDEIRIRSSRRLAEEQTRAVRQSVTAQKRDIEALARYDYETKKRSKDDYIKFLKEEEAAEASHVRRLRLLRERQRVEGPPSPRPGGNPLADGAMALLGGIASAATARQALDTVNRLTTRASDLNEALNKTEVTFGKALGGNVIKWSENSARALGETQQATLDATSNLGLMLRQAEKLDAIGGKISAEDNTRFSQELVQRAADVTSLFNLAGGTAAALEKFKSGLAGETEPLRSLGVFLSEARLQSEALEVGLGKLGDRNQKVSIAQRNLEIATAKVREQIKKYGEGSIEAASAQNNLEKAEARLTKALGGSKIELTEGQKIMLRRRVILEDTKIAEGDFAKTSKEAANAQRILTAELAKMETKLGQELLPLKRQVIQFLLDLIEQFNSLDEATRKTAMSIGAWGLLVAPFAAAVGGMIASIMRLRSAYLDLQAAEQGAAVASGVGKAGWLARAGTGLTALGGGSLAVGAGLVAAGTAAVGFTLADVKLGVDIAEARNNERANNQGLLPEQQTAEKRADVAEQIRQLELQKKQPRRQRTGGGISGGGYGGYDRLSNSEIDAQLRPLKQQEKELAKQYESQVSARRIDANRQTPQERLRFAAKGLRQRAQELRATRGLRGNYAEAASLEQRAAAMERAAQDRDRGESAALQQSFTEPGEILLSGLFGAPGSEGGGGGTTPPPAGGGSNLYSGAARNRAKAQAERAAKIAAQKRAQARALLADANRYDAQAAGETVQTPFRLGVSALSSFGQTGYGIGDAAEAEQGLRSRSDALHGISRQVLDAQNAAIGQQYNKDRARRPGDTDEVAAARERRAAAAMNLGMVKAAEMWESRGQEIRKAEESARKNLTKAIEKEADVTNKQTDAQIKSAAEYLQAESDLIEQKLREAERQNDYTQQEALIRQRTRNQADKAGIDLFYGLMLGNDGMAAAGLSQILGAYGEQQASLRDIAQMRHDAAMQTAAPFGRGLTPEEYEQRRTARGTDRYYTATEEDVHRGMRPGLTYRMDVDPTTYSLSPRQVDGDVQSALQDARSSARYRSQNIFRAGLRGNGREALGNLRELGRDFGDIAADTLHRKLVEGPLEKLFDRLSDKLADGIMEGGNIASFALKAAVATVGAKLGQQVGGTAGNVIGGAAMGYAVGGPIGAAIGGGLGLLGIKLFAGGGRPTPGRAAIVGEYGPEMVQFDHPATVYSAGTTAAMLAAGRHSAAAGSRDTSYQSPMIQLNVDTINDRADADHIVNRLAWDLSAGRNR